MIQKMELLFDRVENIEGKGENGELQQKHRPTALEMEVFDLRYRSGQND